LRKPLAIIEANGPWRYRSDMMLVKLLEATGASSGSIAENLGWQPDLGGNLGHLNLHILHHFAIDSFGKPAIVGVVNQVEAPQNTENTMRFSQTASPRAAANHPMMGARNHRPYTW